MTIELQQRVQFVSRFIGTEGLASESKNGTPHYGRRLPAACCTELQTLPAHMHISIKEVFLSDLQPYLGAAPQG